MKLSVIIPVYNVEKYLDECLNSILKNKPNNVEIIAVNDGSTDNSRLILSKYQNDIRVLDKKNGGLSSARNFGLEHAIGEYIFFLDSDDMVSGDFYEKVIQVLNSSKVDLFFFSSVCYSDSEKKIINKFNYQRGFNGFMNAQNYFSWAIKNKKFFVSACMFIFKREKYNIKFINGILHEDNPFIVHLIFLDNKANCYISENRYFIRRVRDNSITSSKVMRRNYIGYLEGVKYLLEVKKELKIENHAFNYFINHLFHAAILALYKTDKNIQAADRVCLKSLAYGHNLNILSKILSHQPKLFYFYLKLKSM